jgi:hypothetical protein
MAKMKKKNFIQKILDRPGAKGGLHRSLGVPEGEKIPVAKEAAASDKPGKVGEEARLALTLRKMVKRK